MIYIDEKIDSDLLGGDSIANENKNYFVYGDSLFVRKWYIFLSNNVSRSPLIQSKYNYFLGEIGVYEKDGPIYILDQLNEDEKNEIISLLSECNIKRTFDKTIGRTENGKIYSIFLHQDGASSSDMYYIGITEDISYCGNGGGKYYILKYEDNFKLKLQNILENRGQL